MLDTIEANWIVFAAALAAALLVAWWLFGRASSTPARRDYRPDVLDEGAAPAQRNQALIDAAPAAQIVPAPIVPAAHGAAMGGIAEAVAIGAQDVVEEAAVATPEPAPPVASPPPAQPKAKTTPKPKAAKPAAAAKPTAKPQAKAEPAAQPAPAPAPPPPVEIAADDLARIKGLGPKLQALLPTLGLTTFAQIAALSEADLAELDPKLGPFAGRPTRDGWVEQAMYLAAGDVAGFEARFGKV